ncbi:hypothetical protein ACT8ZV_17720 [Nocardioides sp. MAHUQ-72]
MTFGGDRQVLVDYHPYNRVTIPTEDGVVSVPPTDLLPPAFQRPAD